MMLGLRLEKKCTDWPSLFLSLFFFLWKLAGLSVEARYLAGVVQHVALEEATPRETIAANLAVYKVWLSIILSTRKKERNQF